MDSAKIQRIVDWPRPKNVTEINRFIGMVQYYRRYIPGLSEILAPMNFLKKKNVRFVWSEEQELSFQRCKEVLQKEPVLKHPNFDRPFILYTDASNIGIGGVLSQSEEDDPDMLHPIYSGSQNCTSVLHFLLQ
ncbi:hypothetical protein G6F62_014813 [Rhizopus arrhizus]|nr:hypothetical protein G6F62_014813 [Rhizopus arrhizus]